MPESQKEKEKEGVALCLVCLLVGDDGGGCRFQGWYNDIQSDGTDFGWYGASGELGCPYVRIAALEAENAELKETVRDRDASIVEFEDETNAGERP